MILVPYFNAMAYGMKRFTWVNAVTLAGQASYVVALLVLWLTGLSRPSAPCFRRSAANCSSASCISFTSGHRG
jgi:hypothetical protein